MKTSLAWLNTYLDRPATREEAVEVMTRVGFPIEDWEMVSISTGDDWQLDVEVTSNRNDCNSHLGVARELAAGTGRALQPPDCELPETAGPHVEDVASVANEAPDFCPLYTARVIRNVKIGPSPQWLKDRIEAIGLRPVNNVVDITNFVLFEMGQPLHAFDLKLLDGAAIIVRHAHKDEAFTAIDGTKHKLRPDMLVIADRHKPVAIAGVMGGLDSEVGDATTDILLESAIFDPLSVRRTSRALKLASDSSFRFERGVDPLGVDRASRRAANLILELAGGELCQGVIRVGRDDPEPRQVTMRIDRCNSLLGIDVPLDQMSESLIRLGLAPSHNQEQNTITCTVPSHRLDIEREVDIIEEVARLYDLNKLPTTEKIHITAVAPRPEDQAKRRLRDILAAHGYLEAITFSFLSPDLAKPFLPPAAKPLVVEHERRKSEPVLRPSLLPSLLNCRKLNQDVGNENVRLFETASTWHWQDDQLVERPELGIICDAVDPQQSLRDLRGTIEEALHILLGCDDPAITTLEGDSVFSDGATVSVDGTEIGRFGLIDAKVIKAFDLQSSVAGARLALDPLIDGYPPARQVTTLAKFPAIERDVSVIVDEGVSWQTIREAVLGTQPAMLENLDFVVTYRGKPIPKGQKSVSLRMTFRDPEKTLRHDEVDPQVDAVIERLKQDVKAELRA